MSINCLKEFFIKVKTKLVTSCDFKQDYDLTQIEYLIKLTDDFLTEQIDLTSYNFTLFLDEIITTAIMQLDMELLNIVKPFSHLTGEEDEISL